jgi:hypothetical protein
MRENVVATRGTKHKKRSPAARVQRFVRKLLGVPLAGTKPPARPGEDDVFTHLWRSAAAGSAHGKRFSIHQRNVLLFQMGKVASFALEGALLDHGLNCFHCHQLSYEGEARRLTRLFKADPDLRLAAIELKLLAKHTALNMMVRWYRQNAVAPDRRLKVISLTRDPASRFISVLLQRHGYDPKPLADWHRDSAGVSGAGDVGSAASALLRQVAALIVETRPSVGLAAARARVSELAMAMTPPQPYLAQTVQSALDPLAWFDDQFAPMFGIDLRALPEFAASGLAQRNLGFADVLIVRYEDLTRHVDAIARFVGLPALTVPARNVSADKTYGAQILDAARSFQASELGQAFQRELRQSEYGRVCGYDRLG